MEFMPIGEINLNKLLASSHFLSALQRLSRSNLFISRNPSRIM